MAAIKRLEETAHLVSAPDVAALKFRQSHLPVIDVVKDRGNIHSNAYDIS